MIDLPEDILWLIAGQTKTPIQTQMTLAKALKNPHMVRKVGKLINEKVGILCLMVEAVSSMLNIDKDTSYNHRSVFNFKNTGVVVTNDEMKQVLQNFRIDHKLFNQRNGSASIMPRLDNYVLDLFWNVTKKCDCYTSQEEYDYDSQGGFRLSWNDLEDALDEAKLEIDVRSVDDQEFENERRLSKMRQLRNAFGNPVLMAIEIMFWLMDNNKNFQLYTLDDRTLNREIPDDNPMMMLDDYRDKSSYNSKSKFRPSLNKRISDMIKHQ